MKLERNETSGIITFSTETREIMLTMEEAYFIYENMRKLYFNSFLSYTIENAIEENEIDLSKYDGTMDDFTEEIKSCLESLTNYDTESATEEQIIDAIIDTAEFYNLFN